MTITAQKTDTPIYESVVLDMAFRPEDSTFRTQDQFMADAGQAAWLKKVLAARTTKVAGRTKAALPRQRA